MSQFYYENDDGTTTTWLQCDICGEDSVPQREPVVWAVWEKKGWVPYESLESVEQQHLCSACA